MHTEQCSGSGIDLGGNLSRSRNTGFHLNGNDLPPEISASRNWSSLVIQARELTMKKSRYTEEQIIGILKQHEAGVKTADLCREHGISAATFYGWKSKFGAW